MRPSECGDLRLYESGTQFGLTGGVFVSEERLLAVDFQAASSQLGLLTRGGWLHAASETVYNDGVEYLLRVGPLGAVPGASRLVRVRFTEPAYREGTTSVGLRWEATGVTGSLFPVLDADVRVTDAGGKGSWVTLTGSYRPPFGAVGDGLDRLALHTVAEATIRALLAQITAALDRTSGEDTQAAVS